ncbi:hypothetical protein BTO04_13520 [Polaribacter sp. SA4-10]|uniref:hypothetical protein n=1 Tax=Polaribacter sp. SA4-10 TaxID=754397 RepID=UPI000B3C4A13|nr:hypothetical protein [Polaribacter sp. SA4-10]ARV07647.1 hypothetical protein BTO04_13520 [Polaribacter sp. SA4-10]
MSKNLKTQNTFSINFILKGITSILIGGSFLAGTYAIKYLLDTNTTLEKLSPKSIQFLIILVLLAILVSATLTIYFKVKKTAEKLNYNLWNEDTKLASKKYVTGISIISIVLLTLFILDLFNYITPIFLVLYGVFLFIFKNNERKNLLIISGICILLACYCFIIPSYWYSSLSILGIAHITYGVVLRE